MSYNMMYVSLWAIYKKKKKITETETEGNMAVIPRFMLGIIY